MGFFQRLKSIWAFLLPLVIFGISVSANESYYDPVLHSPLGISILIAMFLWDVAGFLFSLRLSSTLQKVIVTLVFQAPLIFLIMLLPAMFTILTALFH